MAQPRNAWTSHLPRLKTKYRDAVDDGLIAGAQVGINAVKRGLRGGFKTGAFTTGQSINSVTRSMPYSDGGIRQIRIGTALAYNLFWELGHFNTWTGQYERKEVWVPAITNNRDAIADAFVKAFKRRMAKK